MEKNRCPKGQKMVYLNPFLDT